MKELIYYDGVKNIHVGAKRNYRQENERQVTHLYHIFIKDILNLYSSQYKNTTSPSSVISSTGANENSAFTCFDY
jgi:hypothetical protein